MLEHGVRKVLQFHEIKVQKFSLLKSAASQPYQIDN